MSAEDEKANPAVDENTTPAEGTKEGGEQETNRDNRNKNRKSRRGDETPVSELYDLTKPIPRVEKPDKAAHEKALDELSQEIEAIKKERAEIQGKIDSAMNDPDAKSTLQTARSSFNEFKRQKNNLIDEKKVLKAQLDKMQNQREKLIKDKKDARNNIRFNSMEEIDKEIAKLQRQQETTTMSLPEEKRLIKEMDALKASKKHVASLQDRDADLDNVQAQRKTISEQIRAKDVEIDAISAQMTETMDTMKKINEDENTKRNAIQELFSARDVVKDKMKEKLKEKDTLRDEFRLKNDEFYNMQRAVREQKKMQYEEEKRKREEEHAAYLAAIEAEEAKKIPYEEEQTLCDYLADYLERTYLGKTDKKEEKKDDFVAAKDDPFAGLTPMKKKDDEEYFGKGKGKKKRVRQAKKQDSEKKAFNLSVDLFEQFGFVSLSPPTSIEQVEQSVKDLRAKKEWYKEQPRGSVATAAEIRKQREKEAAKVRQGTSQASNAPKTTAGGSFSLKKDDFAPLSVAAGSKGGANASWGQQPAAAPTSEPEPAGGDEGEGAL